MRARLGPLEIAALAGSLVVLAYSVAGLAVHPDFGVGDAASSERVVGVDMNGWHAVAGFALVLPAIALLRRPPLLSAYLVAASAGLVATGVWALASTRVAGVLAFPNNEADAVFHFATAAVFLAGVALRRTRAAATASAPG